MRRKNLAALAVLGVFLLGFAGITQAGGWMHKSKTSGSGEMKSPERTSEMKAPEFGTWQHWEAVEAGTLPSPFEQGRSTGYEVPEIRWGGPEAETLVGGIDFRNVDLGP